MTMTWQPFDADVDLWIETQLKNAGIPNASIAVVKGEKTFLKAFGVKKAGETEPVNEHTVFQIASCSKAFASMAVGILVDEGKLNWDDKVVTFFPEIVMHDKWVTDTMTVRDLLTMRLGMTFGGWGGSCEVRPPIRDAVKRLQYVPLECGFREKLTYSNFAYWLISEIVSLISGVPYEEFLKCRLFEQVGMMDSLSKNGVLEGHANCFSPHVNVTGSVEALSPPQCIGAPGSSCVYTSPSDMAQWLKLHLGKGKIGDKRLVPEAIANELYKPYTLGDPPSGDFEGKFLAYCMGWMTRDYDGRRILFHDGGESGASSRVIVDHETSLGIAVTLGIYSPAYMAICYGLMEYFSDKPLRDWWGETIEPWFIDRQKQTQIMIEQYFAIDEAAEFSTDLTAYIGRYFSDESGAIQLDVIDGSLLMTVEERPLLSARLKHIGGDIFSSVSEYPGLEQGFTGRGRARLTMANGRGSQISTMAPDIFIRVAE